MIPGDGFTETSYGPGVVALDDQQRAASLDALRAHVGGYVLVLLDGSTVTVSASLAGATEEETHEAAVESGAAQLTAAVRGIQETIRRMLEEIA